MLFPSFCSVWFHIVVLVIYLDLVWVTFHEWNWTMTQGNNVRISLLFTWNSALIGKAHHSQLPTQSQLEFYSSAHLTLSTIGNRSNNTTPKVDIIPVSRRWPSRLAAQISTFFPAFTHCPLSLSPQAPGVAVTLSWNRAFAGWRQHAAARNCHITLSSTVGRGHLNTGCEGG